jgi:hypothetical protein
MGNKTNIWNRNHNSIKKCAICGKEFKVKWSSLLRRKCCSRECKDKLQSKLIKGNKFNYKKLKGKCLNCNKVFEYSPSQNKKYCNRNCYITAGEKNGRWKGGISESYYRRIKPRYKCEICKSEKNLHIHHINKNHKDNRIENLIVVCKNCHWKIHKNKLNVEVL